MDYFKYILLITLFSAIIFTSGCVITPVGPYAIEEIEIDVAPPPPPVGVVVVHRPPRPSSLYVWIEGHYVISGSRWVWIEGRWDRPDRRGAVWVPPHTRRIGPRYGWTRGHWR